MDALKSADTFLWYQQWRHKRKNGSVSKLTSNLVEQSVPLSVSFNAGTAAAKCIEYNTNFRCLLDRFEDKNGMEKTKRYGSSMGGSSPYVPVVNIHQETYWILSVESRLKRLSMPLNRLRIASRQSPMLFNITLWRKLGCTFTLRILRFLV